MKNITGKAYAMTAFTPIKPWTRWINRLVMWYATTCIGPNDDSDLKKLSFIHFARWVIVPRDTLRKAWPLQAGEPLHYDYMFFESNFNGTWEQYIDAFSDVLPTGLNVIWYWSVRFPGSRPTTPFKMYIINTRFGPTISSTRRRAHPRTTSRLAFTFDRNLPSSGTRRSRCRRTSSRLPTRRS